ncbi:MAG: DUF5995 family protein, partial [Acidimicrobiales bacterium]
MAEAGAPLPTTIKDVLKALDEVVDWALEEESRLGYFAAMYRIVTAKVAEGIEEGYFDDGPRMERLDVCFANRYLAALTAFEDEGRPTRSWELAFEAGASARLLVLQQLILGINAHINLDLGIAAATTAPGEDLPGLRRDFDRINEILALLIAGIERDLGEISPWIRLLATLGGRHDEEVVRWSIEVARTEAWRLATELAPLDPADWPGPVAARDARVARLARRVTNPGWLTAALLLIRSRESNDVRRNIEALRNATGPDLAAVERRVR